MTNRPANLLSQNVICICGFLCGNICRFDIADFVTTEAVLTNDDDMFFTESGLNIAFKVRSYKLVSGQEH